MTIYRGGGGTGEATTDTDITEVRELMIQTEGYRDEAEAFAAAALNSTSEAATSAAAAAASASSAATSASNAATSATTATNEANLAEAARLAAEAAQDAAETAQAAAELAETNAETAETNAEASAAAALVSQNAAASSASSAATSASNSASSASAAASSASAALASQNAAASSAAAALVSQNSAATSAAAAENSASSAAASWDEFDDRYLGAKASNPTVDNDGNALLEGAIYWNTTNKEFRVWNGTGWGYFSGLPSQAGQSGKFLTTNGSVPSWAVVPDPQAATTTNDGLVFGSTPSSTPLIVPLKTRTETISLGSSYVLLSKGSIPSSVVINFDVNTQGDAFGAWLDSNNLAGYKWRLTVGGTVYNLGEITALVYGGAATAIIIESTIKPNTSPSEIYFYGPRSFTLETIPEASGGNVALGYSSGNSGGQNTVIGFGAGSTITTGSNLTVVGYDAEPSSPTATNEATFGNSSTTKTRIWGALEISGQTGSASQVLTSNGSGSAPTWQALPAAPVTSVNGETGAVVLDAADVGAATAAQGANADMAFGWGNHALAGYALDSAVVKLTGDQTIGGTKTFSNLISGSISGNAATVTNGVYTTGSYVNPTWITSLAGSKITGDISGNAATVTNGVYTVGDQTIGGTKTFSSTISGSITGNAGTVTNGVYTTGSYSDPSWITSISGSKVIGNIAGNAATATTATNQSGGTVAATTGSFSGAVTLSAGTAAAPALTTSGDTNTGIFFPAADTIAFSEGGTESMRLNSSGNLGLGVTPSTWGSTQRAIETQAGSLAALSTSTFDLTQNTFNSGTGYIYKTTAAASIYRQTAGQHQWFNAPSGNVGNTVSFTQAMTLNASGNLGIATSSPQARLDISGSVNITGDSGLSGTWSGLATRYIAGNNSTYLQSIAMSSGAVTGGKELSFDASAIVFRSISGSSFAERARIDSSGNLLVGTTTTAADVSGFRVFSSGRINASDSIIPGIFARLSSDGECVRFQRDATDVGSIDVTTTSTSYNTSSDYRLKEDIQPMTGALAKVSALKPVTYKWKVDGSEGEGFIAHELAEVVPQAVTGEKDAVNAEGKPVYQGIDTSFLVATLTAAIQEQQAIINDLKARIETLENK